MLQFEEYLTDFTNTIDIIDFVINAIVAALLSWCLKTFYVRFGLTIANREKFAATFIPLALATMIVITVVQASIALSLGLVGALSIVRFRAAIKEPEELTYLFLAIAIGLVTGANKPILAILAISIVLILLYLNFRFRSKRIKEKDAMFINIQTSEKDIRNITSLLENILPYVELKRMDMTNNGLFVSILTKTSNMEHLAQLQEAFFKMDESAKISVVEQPNLVL
jgi:uncharacterized membrane protein YhiD involved in acid resistance